MKQLAEASLMRLKNWDISEEQVKALAKSGEAKRSMTFRSPVSGRARQEARRRASTACGSAASI